MTLGEALARRDNALNFIRLLLAAAVIVGHSYLLSGILAPSEWLNPRLAEWALNGFFAISGYLIAGSRVRLPWRVFLERRARRLMPGFWVVLIAVAFGFAPVVAWLSDESWHVGSALTYVGQNLGLWIGQQPIADTLTQTPSEETQWNGPLWTLAYEAGCYLAFGLLLGVGFIRRHGAAFFAAVLLVLMVMHPLVMDPDNSQLLRSTVRLTSFFAAGVLVWFLRDRIPARWWVPAAAGFLLAAMSLVSDGQWYGQILAAIGLLTVGALLPVRLGATNDVSYGVYIYGWPVQQSLANLGAASLGIFAFQAMSLLLVLPFAVASWFLVERRWLPQRRRADVAREEPALI